MTIEWVFQVLDGAIIDDRLLGFYHPRLGYPLEFASAALSMSIWELVRTSE